MASLPVDDILNNQARGLALVAVALLAQAGTVTLQRMGDALALADDLALWIVDGEECERCEGPLGDVVNDDVPAALWCCCMACRREIWQQQHEATARELSERQAEEQKRRIAGSRHYGKACCDRSWLKGLQLPQKVYTRLDIFGYHTAQSIRDATDNELLSIRNFGPTALSAVRAALEDR